MKDFLIGSGQIKEAILLYTIYYVCRDQSLQHKNHKMRRIILRCSNHLSIFIHFYHM